MLHHASCALLFASLGCASFQTAYLALPVDERGTPFGQPRTASGLIISGEELGDYESEHFGLLEFTLENDSSAWLRISRMDLDFGGPEQNAGVYLPMGPELDAWYDATLRRSDVREADGAIAFGALFLLGKVVAAIGTERHERALAWAGRALAFGARTAAEVGAQDECSSDVARAQALPEAHLLAVPFSLPPGGYVKRWLLLNTRDYRTPCIRTVLLDYYVQLGELAIGARRSGGSERVLLRFRDAGDRSAWQRSLCQATP